LKTIPLIELRNITKIYGNKHTAVDKINLQIEKGEFVTFLGPSGCGKTTTLRMIAGFEDPTFGELYYKGLDIRKFQPHQRPTATVFQNYSLFPNMNVYENISYGLKIMRIPLSNPDPKKISLIEKKFLKQQKISSLKNVSIDKEKTEVLLEIEKVKEKYLLEPGLSAIKNMRDFAYEEKLSYYDIKLSKTTKTSDVKNIENQINNLKTLYAKKLPIDLEIDKLYDKLNALESKISWNVAKPLLYKEKLEKNILSRKITNDEIASRVSAIVKKIGLEGFERKMPEELSGGQQQRVALARAIIVEPDILLLDEPLSALDAKVRKKMQEELKRLHKELGITFILVTHDQEEALTLSDKIVVMSKGKIEQVGSASDIYDSPINE
jgi:spermidine/putrescine transport system ATP-binding protein